MEREKCLESSMKLKNVLVLWCILKKMLGLTHPEIHLEEAVSTMAIYMNLKMIYFQTA